jgi:hypothetical protein
VRYEIAVPEAAPSPNKYVRAHWTTYQRLKQKWHWLILEALQHGGKPETALRKARVTIVRYGMKKLDRDNLYGSCKPILDALRAHRVIVDDDDEHLELLVQQGERPQGALPCTLIEVLAL